MQHSGSCIVSRRFSTTEAAESRNIRIAICVQHCTKVKQLSAIAFSIANIAKGVCLQEHKCIQYCSKSNTANAQTSYSKSNTANAQNSYLFRASSDHNTTFRKACNFSQRSLTDRTKLNVVSMENTIDETYAVQLCKKKVCMFRGHTLGFTKLSMVAGSQQVQTRISSFSAQGLTIERIGNTNYMKV